MSLLALSVGIVLQPTIDTMNINFTISAANGNATSLHVVTSESGAVLNSFATLAEAVAFVNSFPPTVMRAGWYVYPLNNRGRVIADRLHMDEVFDCSGEWSEDELDGKIASIKFEWAPMMEPADEVEGLQSDPCYIFANWVLNVRTGKILRVE